MKNQALHEIVLSKSEYDSIFELQGEILKSLALGLETDKILEMLCKQAETLLPNSVASIMLIDKITGLMNILSAPSVPETGHMALNSLKPGVNSGSCGNAIFRNKPIYVVDTFHDVKWKDLRQVAYDFNICSCWSMPVRDENKKPIGTFALSSFEHRQPSLFHKKLLETGADIVNIILKNDTQKKIIRQNENRINLFSRALEEAQEGIFITDKNNNIIEVNESFRRILGYTKEEIIGKNPKIFSSGKNDDKFYKDMWFHILKDGYWSGEIVNKNKENKEVIQWMAISAILDKKGVLQNYLALLTDLTDFKRKEEEIKYLVYRDVLTKLYNKTYLEKVLRDTMNVALLILLNMNNFSYVNLAYGFDIGDKLLIAIANELKELCANQEIFRINSDEFAIKYFDKTDVCEKIENIRKHFDKISFYIDDISLNISFSYGVSVGKNASLHNSALALKQAQENGKNKYHIYDKTDSDINQKQREAFLKYNSMLHNALKFELIVPYFQGIMDNRTKKITRYEALARIVEHDEVIVPNLFLKTAKLSGLLPDITKMMIEKTFEYMSKNSFSFSLNITEDDLNLNYLEEFLLEKTKKYNISTKRVLLEILEGISSSGKRDHIQQLNLLKKEGFLIAIDDFGAEYSNFERVLDLDIDFLKIDAKYIKNIDTDSKSYEIVKSIVYFAKNANIICIAEFVHSKSVQKIVEELKIEYSQGYYFSEPRDKIVIDFVN